MVEQAVAPENRPGAAQPHGERTVDHLGRAHRVVDENDQHLVLEDVQSGHRIAVDKYPDDGPLLRPRGPTSPMVGDRRPYPDGPDYPRLPGNRGGEQPAPGSGPGPMPDARSEEVRRRHEAVLTQEEQDRVRDKTLHEANQNAPLDREAELRGMNRAALAKEAHGVGVKVDKGWSDDRLRDEILAAESLAKKK